MPFCGNCGTEFREGGTCPNCAKTSTTHGVRLAEGECIVKEYQATRLKWPKADGYLVVTNRRLIFVGEGHALAGRSVLLREVQLPDVSGVSSYYGKGLSIGLLILAAMSFLFILGLAVQVNAGLLGLLVFPALLVWWLVARQGKAIMLVIHSRAMDESPIALAGTPGWGMFAMFGKHASRSIVARPGPDAEQLIYEIGAVILDLQTRGNLAVETWAQS